MNKSVCVLLFGAIVAPSYAVTLNFDDLTGAGAMVNGYGGCNWTNGAWNYYDGSQPPYNATSGAERIYSSLGFNGEIDFLSPVTLVGAWFNGHGTSEGFGTEQFNMYLGGNLVAQSGTLDLDGSGNGMFLASNYGGAIDRVDVVCSQPGNNFFVMDDLTFNAVPEPASFIVLGLGLAAWARRRR